MLSNVLENLKTFKLIDIFSKDIKTLLKNQIVLFQGYVLPF